ncbi:metallophosphoesterase [Alicyclobacillus hesperidum URH17-3-68]|nr:metallophosphoesterase [Alicyclobacillus hesperidum URH17-3-68]
MVLTILSVKTGHEFNATLTTALFEFVGYLLVARLGFKHRQEQNVLQKRGQTAMTHRDQVMPWHVSNDIRTSLAAVRFLLFPIRDEQNHYSVDEAMNELSRLEKLFEEMEKK